MMIATAEYSYPHRKPFVFLMMAMIILALAAVSMHALEKHGVKAIAASQCTDRPQIWMINPITGRNAFVCMTDLGWGIAITESNGDPVTAFVKTRAKSLQQVIKYLKNAGYQFIFIQ